MALIRTNAAVEPRLHEIGRVFKGSPKQGKEKNGKTYQVMGKDLDYFRFEPAESCKLLPSPNSSGSLYDYLTSAWAGLGHEPKTIPVQFLYSDIASNFDHSYNELWAKIGSAERCTRRCDGTTTVLSLDGNKLTRTPIACAASPDDNECPLGCKPTGRLKFVVPALGYMGLIIMTTHSIYDILELSGNMAFYDGKLAGLPFNLCRSERSVIHDNMGMKKWLCHLAIDPRFGQAFMSAAPKVAMAEIAGEPLEAVVLPEAKQLPPAKQLSIAKETLAPPSLEQSAIEIAAIKKMFMALALEKEIDNVKQWVLDNVTDKPSNKWSVNEWVIATNKLQEYHDSINQDAGDWDE